MNRSEIINRIIEEQQKIIDSLKQSVERYRTASDLEQSTHDPEDFSHQTEAKDMQLRYEQMLRNATNDLSFLETEVEASHDEIENGALINTDKNYLFVGISVPAFAFQDKEVISFSDDTPIFKEIRSKKAGETIKIGDLALKIIKIN